MRWRNGQLWITDMWVKSSYMSVFAIWFIRNEIEIVRELGAYVNVSVCLSVWSIDSSTHPSTVSLHPSIHSIHQSIPLCFISFTTPETWHWVHCCSPLLSAAQMVWTRTACHVQCQICHRLNQIAGFTWPTWGPPGADRTQVGPRLAPWTLLSE